MSVPPYTIVDEGGRSSSRRARREVEENEASEGRGPITVGIWDMGSRVGYLLRLIEALNGAQEAFRFACIEAAVPAGMVSQPERVVAWIQERRPEDKLSKEERDQARKSTIDDDFFERAEPIRKRNRVDYLCGLTPAPIAGIVSDTLEPYWDLFSSWTEGSRSFLVSTDELRAYARQAYRPFEMLIGYNVVAQLLVALHYSRGLGFHRNENGCLFAFRGDRKLLVRDAQRPMIEENCLRLIAPRHREAAQGLVKALDAYEGVTDERARPGERSRPPRLPRAVDVNATTIQELSTLPGIGRATAKRIVAARPFTSVDDLKRVPGIGERKLAGLSRFVKID